MPSKLHDSRVSDSESQVERVLDTISALSRRFIAQEHHRLHNVSGNRGEEERGTSRLYVDKSLCGLLGESQVLHFSRGTEPVPVQHPEVQLFLRDVARTLGKQVDKAEPCTLEPLRAVSRHALQNPTNVEAQTVALIALVAFWGCLRLGSLIPKRPEKEEQVLTLNNLEVRGTSLLFTVRASKTIQFSERTHCIELPAQSESALVPLTSIQPVDLALATPVLPDHIVRAVHDRSYTALAFAVLGSDQPHFTTVAAAHGPLVSPRVCSTGVHQGSADLASNAPRRLENAGGGNDLCRGRSDPETAWWTVEPHRVTAGDDPPT